MFDTRVYPKDSWLQTDEAQSFIKFLGFETSSTCIDVMVLSYDKPLEKLLACRDSLLHQMEEFKLEDKQYDF